MQNLFQTKAVKPVSSLLRVFRGLDFTVVKRQYDLLRLVQTQPYETEQVMGFLKHQPDAWVVLQDDTHPWYDTAKRGAVTLLRHNLQSNAIFLVHLQSRWLLISSNDEVVPAIFLFTEHARDGISVSFYRILRGISLSPLWLREMNRYIKTVLDFHKPVDVPAELEHPYMDMFKFKGFD